VFCCKKFRRTKRNKPLPTTWVWLACYTQEEIAEAVGTSQQNVAVLLKEFCETGLVKLTDSAKAAANHLGVACLLHPGRNSGGGGVQPSGSC
jgi:predicted transcriptional regulator